MEKINIAELLKDCPKGMELDCTIFDDVVFEKVDSESNDSWIVLGRLKSNATFFVSRYGQYYNTKDAKCVIFPKGKTTWEGFVPPCKFKDGDIVATSKGDYVFMLKKVTSYRSNSICDGTCYCAFGLESKKLLAKEANWYFSRLATEEEKAELFKAIKENGYRWDEETKKLEKVSQYPQTFEECCTVLGLTELGIIGGYRRGLLTQFRNLLICRDVYWKIAGKEMELGKPWTPDWKNSEERRYCIVNIEGDINLPEKILTKWILKVTNKILVFPTEEMRDAFYENFKELINECKSLL